MYDACIQDCWRLSLHQTGSVRFPWPACVREPQRSAVPRYLDTWFGIPLITLDNFHVILRHKADSLWSATSHLERFARLQVIDWLATAPASGTISSRRQRLRNVLAAIHVAMYWSCLRSESWRFCTGLSHLCTSISDRDASGSATLGICLAVISIFQAICAYHCSSTLPSRFRHRR
jgi:hypothetical protein